jgi:hypothetical protein
VIESLVTMTKIESVRGKSLEKVNKDERRKIERIKVVFIGVKFRMLNTMQI